MKIVMMVYIYQAPVILISTPYAQPPQILFFIFLAAQCRILAPNQGLNLGPGSEGTKP